MVKHLTAIGATLAIATGISAAGLLLAASGAEAWSPDRTFGSGHRKVCPPHNDCPPCRPGRLVYCRVYTASCGVTGKIIRCP